MAYQIEITQTALEALESVTDRRTRTAIIRRIDLLAGEPQNLGKPLKGLLTGFLSTRAAGQRYRIVYKIDEEEKLVIVYIVGIRKEDSRYDVYKLAEHLVQRGFI
jgi:mRNA interferase RelE/StbE